MAEEKTPQNGEEDGRHDDAERQEVDLRDYQCGLGSWTPDWLQRFATSKSYLVVYGGLGSVQGMAFIYFLSSLTTIEKRFGIQSKTTGWMLSGNELSQVTLSLILSYYGGQKNRPLWIAWGVAFSALSCFILAGPHFVFGSGPTALALTEEYEEEFKHINTTLNTVDKKRLGLCERGERPLEDCLNNSEGSLAPFFIFLSQFVLGIGTTLYYSLGQPYLDDNTKKANTPMLLGSSMSLRLFGTMFSFVLVYLCLKTYINPTLTPTIAENDPRWLGAWWLGWVILGTVMFFQAFFIALFPKKMRRKTEVEVPLKEEEKPALNEKKTFYIGEANSKKSESDFFPSLWRLLKNKILITNILSSCFYILGGSGYMTYMTKNMEVQFYRTSATASIIIGPLILLSVVAGFLISGAIISKFKPRPAYLLGWNVLVGAIFVISEISYIYLACPDVEIVGYDPQQQSFNLLNECNAECGCESAKFSPVYLEERSLTFYSACHAGCMATRKEGVINVYENCTCIPATTSLNASDFVNDNYTKHSFVAAPGVVRDGYNPVDCANIYTIYLVIGFVKNFLGSMGKIGNVLVNYRSVDPVDKPFAQGLALMFVSLFAFIPGPIIFGYAIDATCLIWEKSCGVEGSCWFYDRYKFRLYFNIIAAVFTATAVILDGCVCYYGRKLKLYDEENEGETAVENADEKMS